MGVDREKLRGPCAICGATDYPLSMGGPAICPRCDCGLPPIGSRCPRCREVVGRDGDHVAQLTALQHDLAAARERIEALEKALAEIEDSSCFNDGAVTRCDCPSCLARIALAGTEQERK